MKRSVTIYALLLLLALGGAYRVWTSPEEADTGESVTVLAGAADDLEKVHYHSEKLDLVIELRKDELGRYGWVRAETLGTEPAVEEPENPHAPPKDEAGVAEFKAGKNAATTLEGLMPFRAKRALEGMTDDKLAELGLAEPEATLEIQRAGREPATFEIGGNVYGGANVYVRDTASGKVYVVDAKIIRPLQSGKQSLPDREVVGVETKLITRFAVKGGEASAEFEQHNPDDAENVYWSTAGGSDKNETAAAWIDKALRLRSSGYVQQTDAPGKLEPAYAFTVRTTDRKEITVEVSRGYDENGDELWYAQSEHTRGLVKLQKALAAEAFADLAGVLDAG
ncbi:MAG: DUF4340 domain-containing protein [Nannocystaceae bacterium]|nr:DUF4340 domain-containing protein [Nannocystaceae bacterium]